VSLTTSPIPFNLSLVSADAKLNLDFQEKEIKVDYNSSNEDYSDDGDEDVESYRPGGYHPVQIGEIYNKRYLVVEKMGWGHFSTVWMCRDTSSPSNSFVAMKIQKSASHYREAAYDEIELLRSVKNSSTNESFLKEFTTNPEVSSGVVLLLDHFEHTGPNGKHVCMIFEMLGENLLKVIKNYDYRGISVPVVQNLTRQICLGLDFLHRQCGIIHTDLKPENILIAIPPPPPSDLFVKSLIEQQSTKTSIQEKKKKTKGKRKKMAESIKQMTSSEPKQILGVEGMSPEQKKKLKKKMKKKRQRARKNEKGNGKKKTNKATEENHLYPVDELREMALMEKASEPLGYPILTHSDDEVDEDNLDDEDEEEDLNRLETSCRTLDSLSPKNPRSVEETKLSLLPRSSFQWLTPNLFAAMNIRTVELGSTSLESLPSREDNYPTILPSPIRLSYPSTLQADPEFFKIVPATSGIWDLISPVGQSSIHMVR
jgi:serine/threonine protein kinase